MSAENRELTLDYVLIHEQQQDTNNLKHPRDPKKDCLLLVLFL